MISTLDIMDDVYSVLYGSEIGTTITGDIYKQQRPIDSEVEDIVINSLPVTPGDMQRAAVNVNIHAPDLHLKIGGASQYQPNLARLKQLTEIAIRLLDNVNTDSYHFYVGSHTIFKEDNCHYSNIKLEFYAH